MMPEYAGKAKLFKEIDRKVAAAKKREKSDEAKRERQKIYYYNKFRKPKSDIGEQKGKNT